MDGSQHIPETWSIVLLGEGNFLPAGLSLPSRPLLLLCAVKSIELLVLPCEQHSKRYSKKAIEEHESSTDRLALDIEWGIGLWEDTSTKDRPTLADEIEDHDAHSTTGIRALVVHDPREDIRDSWEDSGSGEEDAEVANPNGFAGCKQDVADATNNRQKQN